MSAPVISIIIPAYNSAKTIEKAINSVLGQQYSHFEILVLDGDSKDDTRKIVNQYSGRDPRIKCFSEKDKGIYDAMNKGIDLAKGSWLFFLGSDDEVHDNGVFQRIFGTVMSGSNHVLYGDVLIKGNTSWARDGERYDGFFDIKKLLRKNICHQSIFYRREFIETEIGHFNIDYKLCADWDFNLRCASRTELFYLDQVIASFNGGGESTHNYLDEKFLRDFVKNVMAYFKVDEFDPMINNPDFPFYHEVLALQRDHNYLRYFTNRLKKKLIG